MEFRFSAKRCYFSCMRSMIICCLVGLTSQFRYLYFLFFPFYVFDGVWCSLCYCCLMIITLLLLFCVCHVLVLSSVVLFMPNTYHIVVVRHPLCSCCFLVFIVLLLINVHHVVTIALHSL